MKKTFWIFLFLAVLDMSVIFSFSAQNSEQSTNISKGIANNIVSDISPDNKIVENEIKKPVNVDYVNYLLRKSAHVSLYTVLGILVVSTVYLSDKIKNRIYIYLTSLFICVFYASTDEFHQLFVPGRSGEIKDIMIDSVGVIFGLLLFFVFEICIFSKRKN